MYRLKLFLNSFFALFAVMRLTGMETRNPVSIIIFSIFLFIFSGLKQRQDREPDRVQRPVDCRRAFPYFLHMHTCRKI